MPATERAIAANTLTDRLAALTVLVHAGAPAADAALEQFRARYRDDPLNTDKWLVAVATRPRIDAVDQVRAILDGPLWQPRNPNRVRAVFGSFTRNNPVAFHRTDGAGYALFFHWLPQLDQINPQVAARQLTAVEAWRRLDDTRAAHIRRHLEVFAQQPLSRDCADVVARLLG